MQYIAFSYFEHSTHLHPGILSITPSQAHLLGRAIFSKYFKKSSKSFIINEIFRLNQLKMKIYFLFHYELLNINDYLLLKDRLL